MDVAYRDRSAAHAGAATRLRARRRLATLLAGAATAALVGTALAGPARAALTDAVAGLGIVAPVAFALLYAGLSLLLVPGVLLTLSAGVLFGPLVGTAVAVGGGAIGATLAFLTGRRLGREQVEVLAGARMRRIDGWLARRGVLAIAVARIVPGVPYNLLNYAAGVTGIPTRQYVAGTVLGLVPGGFAYAALGGTLDDPTSPEFLGSVLLVLVVLGAGALADRTLRRR